MTVQQAIEEAHRCMLCHDAPCSTACPGGTDPARFIRQIRFFNLKGAARTVLGNNPLGEVCAFVCPTEETCTGACLRAGLDRPIDIDGLQAFAAAYGRRVGLKAMQRGPEKGQRVAVVGAGPAGLAAAAKLAQYGYAITVFESRPELGGMLRYGVPRARLPDEVLEADLEDIRDLGIDFRPSAPIEGENGALRLLDEGFAAVFVAPGLWRPYRLDMPGMDAKGVSTAIAFLATSLTDPDAAAALVRGRNVAVIGGGSVAMDVAHTAQLLGAERIYSIALESMTELPAAEREFEGALAEGVIFKPQCQVTRVLVEDGAVTGVEGHETEWIEPGKLVPSNARPVEGTFFRLRVGAVIQSIGQGLTDAAGMMVAAASEAGALVSVDAETQATRVERIFAGGDFSRGAGTVVDAVGDGKRAATAIHEFLTSKGVSA
jgi:NADPH-dependent glutamate synthase beta subunit-like oxidoreductase